MGISLEKKVSDAGEVSERHGFYNGVKSGVKSLGKYMTGTAAGLALVAGIGAGVSGCTEAANQFSSNLAQAYVVRAVTSSAEKDWGPNRSTTVNVGQQGQSTVGKPYIDIELFRDTPKFTITKDDLVGHLNGPVDLTYMGLYITAKRGGAIAKSYVLLNSKYQRESKTSNLNNVGAGIISFNPGHMLYNGKHIIVAHLKNGNTISREIETKMDEPCKDGIKLRIWDDKNGDDEVNTGELSADIGSSVDLSGKTLRSTLNCGEECSFYKLVGSTGKILDTCGDSSSAYPSCRSSFFKDNPQATGKYEVIMTTVTGKTLTRKFKAEKPEVKKTKTGKTLIK